MNILLFSRILAKTGVGNHINELSNALQIIGNDVCVVSGTKDIELINSDVEYIYVNTLSRNPITVFKSILALRKIIKERKIDVVHCHHRVAAIYMRLYNLLFKIPVVYTLHLANIPCDFFHRKLTFPGNMAIGVSTEVSRFLIEKLRISSSKVTTVLNGVNDELLLPLSKEEIDECKHKWNIPQENLVIALHSRIDVVKNHLLVVEAINQLSDEEKKKITVICSGQKEGEYYNKVRKTVSLYNLDKVFNFVGWTKTREILGISDFLFLPSTNEGFGLSVAEAFLMRVPVARTITAGFEDLKYCIPISMEDPFDIVAIIREAVSDGMQGYADRINSAYEFAKETLTAEKMAINTVDVYKKVCSKNG